MDHSGSQFALRSSTAPAAFQAATDVASWSPSGPRPASFSVARNQVPNWPGGSNAVERNHRQARIPCPTRSTTSGVQPDALR